MCLDTCFSMRLVLLLALAVSSDAFFLKWGSDPARQNAVQKTWLQPMASMQAAPPAYRYYQYSPYGPYPPPPQFDTRKMYQQQGYPQQGYQQDMLPQSVPIPISVPAGASLTPVSLQHVQLVPCMCPVAPEEAEKLQEQVGPGPYLAQTYSPPSYSISQQNNQESAKTTTKQ